MTNSPRRSEDVLDTINQNWFWPWGPFCCRSSFLHIKPTRGHWAWANCIESKNRRHFFMPTFWDLQLFTLVSRWFEHFKGPKNAPWVCFGRFSSRVKRCIRVCLQRFTRELKRLNQTQGAFLDLLKSSNHLQTKVKSCRSQNVGIKKWRRFFHSMQFAHAQCPLVGFICRKELLQQNRPQGQN